MRNNTLLVIVIIILIIVIIMVASPRSYYTEINTNPILSKIHEDFIRLNPEYEKIPLREGNSAYTENKSVITLCLKDPDTKQYYPYCVLMYVALHELSHMVSKDYGHGVEFQKNFGIILRKAAELGIYNPECKIPATYCGLNE